MTTVGIRALKQNASAVIARVEAGEEVVVTDRGRPVAEIVPLRRAGLQRLAAAGRVRPPRLDIRDLPEPRPAESASAARAARRDADRA